MTANQIECAKELIDFLYANPTGYHVVSNVSRMLQEKGFKELCLNSDWNLKAGGKYFVVKDGSALFAFVNSSNGKIDGFKIIGTHLDSPSIKIKPDPEIIKEGFLQLNTEVYGSPLLSTWFDRPLSLAGRVFIKTSDVLKPEARLINITRPLAVIPNLAIHMNREVNKNLSINNQKDLIPLTATVLDENFCKNNYLLKFLSKETAVKIEDILDFELFLYEHDKGCIMGVNQEFISSSRLDDQEAVHAGLQALMNSKPEKMVNLLACFDNEEAGSGTKQGANSQLLSNILERIVLVQGGGRVDFLRSIADSFMVSVDGAHSVHPNYLEKSDITNKPVINRGPVLKVSANKKYTSDAESIAVLKSLAMRSDMELQYFVNHSNEPGGSTIGPLSNQHLEMRSVDIGSPILGMHSIRELAGVKDHYLMIKLLSAFFKGCSR